MVRLNAEGCEMVLLYVLDVCTSSAAICMNQIHHKPTSIFVDAYKFMIKKLTLFPIFCDICLFSTPFLDRSDGCAC